MKRFHNDGGSEREGPVLAFETQPLIGSIRERFAKTLGEWKVLNAPFADSEEFLKLEVLLQCRSVLHLIPWHDSYDSKWRLSSSKLGHRAKQNTVGLPATDVLKLCPREVQTPDSVLRVQDAVRSWHISLGIDGSFR